MERELLFRLSYPLLYEDEIRSVQRSEVDAALRRLGWLHVTCADEIAVVGGRVLAER